MLEGPRAAEPVSFFWLLVEAGLLGTEKAEAEESARSADFCPLALRGAM